MKLFNFITISIALTGIVFSGCQKREIDDDTQTASDVAYAKMSYSTFVPIVNHIGIDEEGVGKTNAFDPCASITIEETNGSADGFPKTVTIDYGTAACVGIDGRSRKGILSMVFSTGWSNDEVEVSISLNDFHIDGIKHEGSIHLVKSVNSIGNKEFSVQLSDGEIFTSGGTIEYSATRTVEWLSGATTSDTTDDHYKIGGSSSGVNREGRSFESAILVPLERDMSCDYISKGVIELTPNELAIRKIDFGDGACDNKATIEVRDNIIEIILQ